MHRYSRRGAVKVNLMIPLSPRFFVCLVWMFSWHCFRPWLTLSYQHRKMVASLRFQRQAIFWCGQLAFFTPFTRSLLNEGKCLHSSWTHIQSIAASKVSRQSNGNYTLESWFLFVTPHRFSFAIWWRSNSSFTGIQNLQNICLLYQQRHIYIRNIPIR